MEEGEQEEGQGLFGRGRHVGRINLFVLRRGDLSSGRKGMRLSKTLRRFKWQMGGLGSRCEG